jgi:hypothetical protein
VCALSDAFQAIVEFEPIAIWARVFCVEISQGEALCFVAFKKERYETVELAAGEAEMRTGRKFEAGGANGVTAERFFVSDVAGRI